MADVCESKTKDGARSSTFIRIESSKAPGMDVTRLHKAATSDRQAKVLLTKIQEADSNGDGWLSVDELLTVFRDAVREEKAARMWRLAAAVLVVTCLMLVAATVGLTAVVIVKTKDTKVENDTLTSKSTGAPVMVDLTGMHVDPTSKSLVTRGDTSSTPVGVRAQHPTSVTANISPDQLQRLDSVNVNISGVEVNVRVQGSMRLSVPVSAENAPWPSRVGNNSITVLILYTPLGKLVFTSGAVDAGDDDDTLSVYGLQDLVAGDLADLAPQLVLGADGQGATLEHPAGGTEASSGRRLLIRSSGYGSRMTMIRSYLGGQTW